MNNTMKKHFINPQNMGQIKKPTHTSKKKSGFCGDTVEVYAVINDGKIESLKYNVFGCYAVIAASSIISEWAQNKTLDELKALTFDDTLVILGGELEEGKDTCVKTALEAFTSL